MPKEIRFAQLVKECGAPETVTLWTDPENNPALMKAAGQNRVLTIVQRPAGNRKDFGTIGFHKEDKAFYMIFPKPLPRKTDAQVIGIKYDMIQEVVHGPAAKLKAASKHSAGQKPAAVNPEAGEKRTTAQVNPLTGANGHGIRPASPPPRPAANPRPAKTFLVKILRTAISEVQLTVKAETFNQAGEMALETVREKEFDPGPIQDEVKSVSEI